MYTTLITSLAWTFVVAIKEEEEEEKDEEEEEEVLPTSCKSDVGAVRNNSS